MSKRAIVAGHTCIDIIPVFPEGKVRKVSEILIPGKLINVGRAVVNTGGAVPNTGLAMKIFGADVRLVGKIGTDEIGGMILNVLKQYDAQDGMILTDEGESSYTIALAPPGIDRMFLHFPGQNDTFRSADISDEVLDQGDMFHFGYPPLMRSMYENDGDELVAMFRRVKEHGLITSLDFTSIDPEGDTGKVNWEKLVQKVLPYVDFFVPSVEELCYMLDQERYQEWQIRADGGSIESKLSLDKDVRPLADRLMEWGAKAVMIKCGAPGMYYRTSDETSMKKICERLDLDVKEWASMEGFEPSFIPECVRSATGAGDTSIGAFLTSVSMGYSLKDSVTMATAAGASCVEQYSALGGLKPFCELQERIRRGWKKAEPLK